MALVLGLEGRLKASRSLSRWLDQPGNVRAWRESWLRSPAGAVARPYFRWLEDSRASRRRGRSRGFRLGR